MLLTTERNVLILGTTEMTFFQLSQFPELWSTSINIFKSLEMAIEANELKECLNGLKHVTQFYFDVPNGAV